MLIINLCIMHLKVSYNYMLFCYVKSFTLVVNLKLKKFLNTALIYKLSSTHSSEI